MKKLKFDPNRIAGDISKQAVDHLQNKRKKTVKQIAELAGVSESFIYRVKRTETNFTALQFSKINHKVKGDIISLPDNASEKTKELYLAFRTILKCLASI